MGVRNAGWVFENYVGAVASTDLGANFDYRWPLVSTYLPRATKRPSDHVEGTKVTLAPGTVTTLAKAVRERRVSATALVTASIERVERAEALNVMAGKMYDDALREARRVDNGETSQGALLGVPTLIKDLEDLAGYPTRKGSLALRDDPPALTNGVVPGRLLEAGAMVIGKSTLPEFAIEGYTANPLTGVTRNPWNLDYSPGGSSGGSAAALAAGLVGVATATDGGGSVRIPASLCGLVGLKPTNGAVGRWPAPDWIDYSTDGPMATSCDDLRLLFDVMRGSVSGDPTSPPFAQSTERVRREGRPLQLFAAERTSPFEPLGRPVAALFHEAVDAFADRLDASVIWLEAEGFFADGDPDLDWFVVTSAEHVASLGRAWIVEHMEQFHVATQEFLATGLDVSIDEYLAARRRRYLYVRTMDELLKGNGLLLTPSVASAGWLADGRLHENDEVHGLPPEVLSTVVQNITGHPAITIPFGQLSTSLPFGLQVTAEHYHDDRLIDIAALMEAAYPWPRTASGYEGLEMVMDSV
jgi:Asp-tRNA(Asn)/Glu-tRNA(Gln) amidotransferase A subunit family amidase